MMHPDVLAAEASSHRSALLATADEARAAKLVRRTPGPVRTKTGRALVRLGHKLADLS
jgi:hypothetical protein